MTDSRVAVHINDGRRVRCVDDPRKFVAQPQEDLKRIQVWAQSNSDTVTIERWKRFKIPQSRSGTLPEETTFLRCLMKWEREKTCGY